MKVLSYKMLAKMDEKVLATYAAYKGYFPNSIITKDSARHIFESGRTKEKSYQVVNRQIKLLKKHGLLVKHGKGLRLISKMEISDPYHSSPNRGFAKIENKNVKETRLEIVKVKLKTKLAQLEFRSIIKSKRPSKSIKRYVTRTIKKSGAFVQVSYIAIAKACNMNVSTLTRMIKSLHRRGEVQIIGGSRKKIRRLAKLEQPFLSVREFVYKNWVYKVTSPSFKVANINLNY